MILLDGILLPQWKLKGIKKIESIYGDRLYYQGELLKRMLHING